MSCKGFLPQTRNGRGQIEDKCKKNIDGKHCLRKNTNSNDTFAGRILHDGDQDVAENCVDSENVSSSRLEIATSTNFILSNCEMTSDIANVNVDEWFKQRPESVNNMDLDSEMKTDGIDNNYLNDAMGYNFLSSKDSVDMCIVTNICDMGLGLDISAHACDKNKLGTLVSMNDKECTGRILSDFHEQNPLLDDLARSEIIDKDTMLVQNSEIIGTHKFSLLHSCIKNQSVSYVLQSTDETFRAEEDSITQLKSEKQDKENNWTGNEIVYNQSLHCALDNKDKVNWESLSIINRQNGDFDSEKDVDFPEFNLLTFQVDSNEGINAISALSQIGGCSKELSDGSNASLLETNRESENILGEPCGADNAVLNTSETSSVGLPVISIPESSSATQISISEPPTAPQISIPEGKITENTGVTEISIPETSDIREIRLAETSSVSEISIPETSNVPGISIPETYIVSEISISETPGLQVNSSVSEICIPESSNVEIFTDSLIAHDNLASALFEPEVILTEFPLVTLSTIEEHNLNKDENQISSTSISSTDSVQQLANGNRTVLISNPRSILRSTPKNAVQEKQLLPQKTTDQNSILKSASCSSQVSTSTHSEQENIKAGLTKKTTSPSMAIIAISTDKSKNTTEIVINTSHGEQKFKGKTSDLMKATSNLWTRLDSKVLKTKLGQSLNISGVDGTSALIPSTSVEVAKDTDQSLLDTSETNMDLFDRTDDSSDVPDDQPITEALSELGVDVDGLFSVTTSTGQKLWACPSSDCNKMYPRLSMMKVHILTHFGMRPYRCDFAGCHWTFYTYFKLKRHTETHLKRKAFLCPVANCGRRFSTVYNLNTHQKLHARPAEMVCPVESCSARFQTKRSMELHMKKHDSHHAPYKCTFEGCGKHYYSSNSLNSHARSHHHKEEEVKCQWQGCGKLFDKPCRLKAHMRTHTGDKPYPCTYVACGWAFSSASKLKRHQHKHTNERKFECSFVSCGKSFMRSEHLKEHTLTHAGGRTFRCPVENCGVKFSAKSSLYVHLKKHNSAKTSPSEKLSYHCRIEECSRMYTCKSSLRQHMLRFHTPVSASDSSQLDYIALLTGDDDLATLEGVQFAGDITSAANGGVNLLNTVSLLAPTPMLPICTEGISTIPPEFISSDFLHVLTPQLGTSGIITHVGLAPPDNQTSSILMSSTNLPAPAPEVNHVDSETMTEQLEDIPATEINIVEAAEDDPTCVSARTTYTYEDIVRDRERKHGTMFLDSNLMQNSDTNGLRVPTDVVLGTSMLGNAQDMAHNLLLQDDHHNVYQEDPVVPGVGEFQVLLLDPGGSSRQEFAESTINLRDLE